ncbi:MAG: S9 family peptidase [Chitinophagaceae bacterium]|nr:S9 family peptidase [Chitinophagaceae bacterium]
MGKKMIFICAAFLLPVAVIAQKKAETIQATDLLKIQTVSQVTMSADGKKAVFLVTSAAPENESKKDFNYKYYSAVWLAELEEPVRLRKLTSEQTASQPAISPDGSRVAFIRNVNGKGQIFVLPLDGGEAIQITNHKYGASAPKWSPDGKEILFSASVPFDDLWNDSLLNPNKLPPSWPMEKPGIENRDLNSAQLSEPNPDGTPEEVRSFFRKNEEDNKATVINRLNFLDENDIQSKLSFTHFFITKAEPKAQICPVTRGFFHFQYGEFTPDGQRIILSGNADSATHPDRSLDGSIYIVNKDGTQFRKLLGKKGINYTTPRVSPKGKWLAFQFSPSATVSVPVLGIISISDSLQKIKEIDFDRNKNNITWSEDERYLYFSALSGGGQPLFRYDFLKSKTEQLTEAQSGILSFDVASGKIVFVKTEIRNPYEVYVCDADGRRQKRISDLNTGWLAGKKISVPEKFSFRNEQGMEVDYWVMKPIDFQSGMKYPLLLEIHGGPSAMWGPGEPTMWHEFQFFCAKGYGVVYSNPRGSGGYGTTFLRANMKDWGKGPSDDVLHALQRTISLGWVDTNQLFITGGSYAGYLVAWIISHDSRFRAACSQRGVYDLATFFGEGNAWRLIPNYFGGYPWEKETKAVLERESPVHYVENIKTPYLILHGDNDRRTGFVQSEVLYKSLKAMNRPVEYVRYPGANHELTRSGNLRQRMDHLLRMWEFFERWRKN